MELNLTLYRDGQSPISTSLELKSAHSVRQKLTDLFEELDETSQFSGWLQLESNIEGIAATIEMEFPRSITAIPFVALGSNRLVFSHQASSGGISTGLALVNPAAEAGNVTLRLFSPAGELLDSSQIFIESRSRISKLVNELFTTPDLNIGGFIEVESDQPLAGIETLFRNDLEALAAIVAQ
jgi:hypothetical protein